MSPCPVDHKACQCSATAEDPCPQVETLRAEAARMRRALHEITEEWAGAECGEPVHAQEAYAIDLAKRMYALAAEGLAQVDAARAAEEKTNG